MTRIEAAKTSSLVDKVIDKSTIKVPAGETTVANIVAGQADRSRITLTFTSSELTALQKRDV